MMPLSNLKVACILDEFSYECFRYECKLIKVNPTDSIEKINNEKPDLLLVESAWRGNDHAWRFKLGNYKNNDYSEIKSLVAHCKKSGIPTVFWNKEDPVHFNFFLNAAKLFDYVFTSDENKINEYKHKLGHDRIYVLPFAAQPKIHHPIQVKNYRSKNVFFAGTYYGNHHKERKIDMDLLLRVASRYDLDIYDRNYNLKTNYQYPYQYRSFIRGHLPYKDLLETSKQYKVALNVNSVKTSPTMCARRVFEMLASGVTVLTNKTKAMDTLFPHTVLTFTDALSIRKALHLALRNETWRRKHEVKGIRHVLSKHTYAHRLYQIASTCKLNVLPITNPTILLLGLANNEMEADLLVQHVKNQKYENKRALFFAPTNLLGKLKQTHDEVRWIDHSYINKKMMNWLTNEQYFSILDPYHYYGTHYLTDLAFATKYADAKIIGKGCYYIYDSSLTLKNEKNMYTYVTKIRANRSIIHHSLVKEKEWSFDHLLSNSVNEKIFSIDPFNFCFQSKRDPISTINLNEIIG